MSRSIGREIVLAATVMLAVGAHPAMAAGDANAARGIVAEYCARCHQVPGYSTKGLETLDAPRFQAIADDSETYTAAHLRTYLRKPHWPMRQFHLSPRDIENLIAFIEDLRAN